MEVSKALCRLENDVQIVRRNGVTTELTYGFSLKQLFKYRIWHIYLSNCMMKLKVVGIHAIAGEH
ncbi:MAG: hypothetical protein R3E08_09350 [Thiotrichaceae bacterium]